MSLHHNIVILDGVVSISGRASFLVLVLGFCGTGFLAECCCLCRGRRVASWAGGQELHSQLRAGLQSRGTRAAEAEGLDSNPSPGVQVLRDPEK